MSRLIRPSIPLAVRLAVARRQLGDSSDEIALYIQVATENRIIGTELKHSLVALAEKLQCPRDQLRLDHDPALENREKVYRNGEHVDYKPAANDPSWLFYRPHGPQFIGSHLIKTNIRGEHGQHSDRALAAKNKNIAKNRDPKRKKAKIPQRKNPWPKGRTFRRKPR